MRTPMKMLASWLWDRWDFFLHHFLTHFCHFLPLPLTLLLILGLLLGAIGTGVGAQSLIYHDDWQRQVVSGFALTVVAVECLLVGYLFEYGRRRRQYQGGFLSHAVQTLSCVGFCLGVVWVVSEALGFLSTIMPGGDFIRFAGQENVGRSQLSAVAFRPGRTWGVLCGAVCGILMAVAVFVACRRRADPESGSDTGPDGGAGPGPSPSHFVYLFWLTAAACGWYVGVTYIASRTRFWWGWIRPELVIGLAVVPVVLYALDLVPVLRASRQALFAEVKRTLRIPRDLAHRRYRLVALAFASIAFIALGVLSFAGWTASPVPPVCAVLLALLAAYGFLSVVVRRGMTIPAAGLVVLLSLSGTVPYKFRFPGLEKEYKVKPGTLDLEATAKAEWKLQEELAGVIRGLSEDKEFERLRETVANQDLEVRKIPRSKDRKTELEAARNKLSQLKADVGRAEYEKYRRDAAVPDGEPAFAGTRVIPLRDTRPDAPLERAEEGYLAEKAPATGDRGRGRLLLMSDIQFLTAEAKARKVRKPMVIVTVSGGGLRSAAWTLRVLQELELRLAGVEWDGRPVHFPSHVRIIAGASGGMLGAGYYTATVKEPEEMPGGDARVAEMREHYQMLTQDFLTPIMKGAVYSDLPLFLSPSPVPHDRGKVLEEAWVRSLRQRSADPPTADPATEAGAPLALSFAELRKGEVAGWRPSLIFSPMLIEDGRRVLVSNLDLRWVASNDGSSLNPQGALDGIPGGSKNYSFEAFELFRLFPDAKDRKQAEQAEQNPFRLRTAVRMSASFPYFSPAVSLPVWPRRRVVDAGYYDNYGVSVAASWLFSGRHEEWIRENVSKVVIIQIRDGVSDEQRRLRHMDADPSSTLSRSVEEFIAPLEGLDNGRVGSSSFRNDGQLELLTKYFRTARGQSATLGHEQRFLTTVTFEFPLSASLSWYLSGDERRAINSAAQGEVPDEVKAIQDKTTRESAEREIGLHKQRMDKLVEWWRTPVDE